MANKNDFIKLKKLALDKYFENMNDNQRKAVFSVNGPVLILAGAGSGKTTVLVNRITNMIHFGNTYNNNCVPEFISESDLEFLKSFADGKVNDINKLKEVVSDNSKITPWSILAITFTNKAAGELKERLKTMLGEDALDITAATFHSACVRILRREIGCLGYDTSFTIYDSDDTQRLIKACLSDLNISDKQFPAKTIQSIISGAKDQLITEDDFIQEAEGDYRKQVVSKVYSMYQKRLKAANALDFDDIIKLTVEIFEKFPDVLAHYQNRYKYIMVDEYQDTNQAQFRLVGLLSEKHHNLCVVGDDDQSIYKFRGATIENILNFEEQFSDCTTIRLEQNYRSTQNILSAANSVIKNNSERKPKSLWTSQGDGDKITVFKSFDETEESRFVAETVLNNIKKGMKYGDHAVLYRMNAQSNSLERAFVASGIPYKVIGGMRFYDRKEIKDITAYLSVINNFSDMLRLKRIINEPKRGLGDTTVAMIEQISGDLGINPIEIMLNSAEYAPISKKSSLLVSTAKMFVKLSEEAEKMPLNEFLDMVLEKTGYLEYMNSLGEEGITRLENINELKTTIADYQKNAEEPSLSGFLEEISLYTDVDKYEENTDTVVMMTMHSAKGLEFPQVFIVGMEEGIFPGMRSMNSQADIEEERRLAYVAITRAKKKLYISLAAQRMLFGQTSRNIQSRFLKEIDPELIERIDSGTKVSKATESGIELSQSANPYSLEKQIFSKKSADKAVTKTNITFNSGDRVLHNIFGEGTVISVKNMANDFMLEVAFDKVGTKKIMANFAKITKM